MTSSSAVKLGFKNLFISFPLKMAYKLPPYGGKQVQQRGIILIFLVVLSVGLVATKAKAGLVSSDGESMPYSMICDLPANVPNSKLNPTGGELQILSISYNIFTVVVVPTPSSGTILIPPQTILPLIRCQNSAEGESPFTNNCEALDSMNIAPNGDRFKTLLSDDKSTIFFEIEQNDKILDWELSQDQCHTEDFMFF